ncbi:DUF5305 family protein [Sporosarcina sp. SAFN-015]|uniref:DUF5305 family protein n=1 Tax=Sporosarcina sp. SAFN-015 TaxID=3387274 RepID=UPI003F821997
MKQFLMRWNKTRNLILSSVLAVSIAILIYSFLQPTTSTTTTHSNPTGITTIYDYKATIKPNVLNTSGGTVPVGDTILKKITTAIPIDMKTIITSTEDIVVEGEHEVQLTVVAQDLWEKTFPLEKKQSFQQKGTAISIMDGTYSIDLDKINAFITQAEEETGITPSKYSLLVTPMIKGTIHFDGIKRELQVNENLVFHYLFDSIVLASEKEFTSPIQFGSIETITNTLNFLGVVVPVSVLRISSLLSSLVLSLLWIYVNNIMKPRKRKSQIESINKKYGNRIIAVSRNEGMDGKSILLLSDIKSLLKIADEKELPIFVQQEGVERASYFIVDGNQLYKYEAFEAHLAVIDEIWDEGRSIYAEE